MYLDHVTINARLAALKAAHPTLCDVESLANRSNEGREIKMLRLMAGVVPIGDRPAVLITAGIHAREWAQPDAIVTFAEKLLASYAAPSDFVAMNYTLEKDFVKALLEKLVVYIIPLVNPDGREHSFIAGNERWRKNRTPGGGGVDINRNFDILWDFELHYVLNCGVRASKDPNEPDVYIGPAVESEPETKNVKRVLEDKGILYLFDLHSAVPGIFHVWGLDTNQGTESSKNFGNPIWDHRRDGIGTGATAYQEFIPDPILRAHQTLAALMQQAIIRAAGRAYPVAQSASGALYVTTGAVDDYAFSRDMERRLCFTIEFGDYNVEGFHPDIVTQYPKIEAEVHAAMARALDRLAGPPLTGGGSPAPASSPAPPSPSTNPILLIFNAIRRFFGWLLGPIFNLFAATSVRPISYSPPRPTSSSVPPPSSVHSLRIDPSSAGAGQRVRGVLLDASLDFTQVQKPLFNIFLQVPPRAGATGNLFWRVTDFRFLGPRELEFTVPPVGTGSAMMVPPGAYIVLCRYGFWTVEGDRLLTVR